MIDFPGGVITGLRGKGESLVIGWSLAAVTFATGFISYTHISALVINESQNWKTAHLMPVVVDGQIAIGSGYFMKNAGKRRRWFGLLGFLPGLVESVVANWVSGYPHGFFAAAVATVPAQAFACSSYLFERYLHEQHPGLAKKTMASVIAASHLAMARVSAELAPQAPEPAAPAAPAGPAPVHLHAAPGEAPWGRAAPAGAPPEPAAPAAPAALLGQPVPVLGPATALAARPARAARPRPRAVPAAGDPRLPLPEGEQLRALLADPGISANQMARDYNVTRYTANEMKKQFAAGELATEDVKTSAAA